MTGRIRAGFLIGFVALLAAFTFGRVTAQSDDVTGAPAPAGTPGAGDIAFAQEMAQHHDQAVLMANLAIDRGRTAVHGLALSILGNQAMESGTLRGWLTVWGQPQVAMMSDAHDHSSMTEMPGMATSAELDRLYNLHGKKFDVLFLRLMIRHHQGALIMVKAAEQDATLDLVRTSARNMGVAQLQEISTMKALLHEFGGKELAPPTGG